MGTWGAGLYGSDIANDLKSTIGAVVELPFEPARLVEILKESFSEVVASEDEEDYTTFWLVLADQFHRRGIVCPEVYEKAIDIIDSGMDLKMAERLEMGAADLRKRGAKLNELRAEWSKPVKAKPRKTLKQPQPLLMTVGDVMVYPIGDESCINPYHRLDYPQPQDGWGAAVIIACGQAFEFLAYYTPIVVTKSFGLDNKPTVELLQQPRQWMLEYPGTCSKAHFGRMRLEKAGHVDINPERVNKIFPALCDGVFQAVNDISIANCLKHHPLTPYLMKQTTAIDGLSVLA